MKAELKIRLLTYGVVGLGLLTISMLWAFFFHTRNESSDDSVQLEFYSVQMTGRDFRDLLNFSPDQMDRFRGINNDFRKAASSINVSLDQARNTMFFELKEESPDMERCRQLSAEIGKLHTELKVKTCEFYLQTREICDPEQLEELEKLFIPIFTSTGGFGYGRGHGQGQGQGPGQGQGRFGRRFGQ